MKLLLKLFNHRSLIDSMSNTNLSDRKWVVNALTFWQGAKPNKFANRKLINWNIEQLTKVLNQHDQERKEALGR